MNEIKAPSKLLMLTEGRSLFELGAGLVSLPFVKKLVPQGDGQPVLVLPGLGAGDLSTKLLRVFLKDLGYIPYGWDLGVNRGMQGNMLGQVVDKIKTIHSTHNRKVSLVGQSLGGIFARESAKAVPDMVRQVITLGSPFTGSIDATNAQLAYSLLSGQAVTDKDREFYASVKIKPNVPTTSIYSKMDGIVSWKCSIEESTDMAENIELVGGTHIGMASSPTALYVIAHRLAEREGYLQPFTPVAILRPFYN
jgi:Palmitoyl protein thioesterase